MNRLPPTIIAQIISPIPPNILGKDKLDIKCPCGTVVTISYRSLYRKWGHKSEYLCKSCHVQTYVADPERIAKFQESFAKIVDEEHRQKCSASAKVAWQNEAFRERQSKLMARRNHTDPRLSAGRKKATETFRQSPGFMEHMRRISKIAITNNTSSTDQFIAKALLVHGDKYSYDKVDYISSNDNIIIICQDHGEFLQTPHNHLAGKGCSKCPVVVSQDHQSLLDILPPDLPYVVNCRDTISPFELDIWLPDYKLGIEVHGEYWHGVRHYMSPAEKHYIKWRHKNKAQMAADAGIKLFQLWAHEINSRPNLILSMINHATGRSQRIYARSCKIIQLKSADLQEFWHKSHLHGHRGAAVNLALEYQGQITAAIAMSRTNIQGQWEIIRFASRPNSTVTGGFSKLLKHFIRTYGPNSILTYADRRISHGNVYQGLFRPAGTTDPNYFFYKGRVKLSRQQCQKHKLHKLLGDQFDPNLSAVVNMLNAGYTQVFDAGHLKYIWQK